MYVFRLLIFILIFASCKEQLVIEKDAIANVSPTSEISLDSSELSEINFGEVLINTTETFVIKVTKNGRFPVVHLSMDSLSDNDENPFRYTEENYPGLNGTCTSSMGQNYQSCLIEIAFSPEEDGFFEHNFSINFNDGLSIETKTVKFRGYGGSHSSLVLNDNDDLDFGLNEPPFSETRIFSVKNVGGLTATNITASMSGNGLSFTGSGYPGANGTCNGTLSANQECSVEVYTNGPVEDNYRGNVNFTFRDVASDKSENLFFISRVHELIGEIELINTDPAYTFTDVLWEDNVTQTVEIVNKKYNVSRINSIDLSPDNTNFVIDPVDSTCTVGGFLQIGQKCKIVIKFTAPRLSDADVQAQNGGSYNTSLNILYNNGKVDIATPLTVDFLATGKIPGILETTLDTNPGVELDNYDFGNIGFREKREITIRLKNIGSESLTNFQVSRSNLKKYVTSPSSNPNYTDTLCQDTTVSNPLDPGCYTGYEMLSNTCSTILTPNQVCDVRIEFFPNYVGIHNLNASGIASPVTISYRASTIDNAPIKVKEVELTGSSTSRPILDWFLEENDLNPVTGYTFVDTFETGSYSVTYPQFRKRLWLKNTGATDVYNISDSANGGISPSWIFRYVNQPFVSSTFIEDGLCADNIPLGKKCYVDIEVFGAPLNSGEYDILTALSYTESSSSTDYHTNDLMLSSDVLSLGSASLVLASAEMSIANNFGEVSSGAQKTVQFSVRNQGDLDISNISYAFTNNDENSFSFIAPDSVNSPACSGSIIVEAEGTCILDVRFTPTSLGTKYATIRVNYHNGFANTFSEITIRGDGANIGHFIVDEEGVNNLEPWRNLEKYGVMSNDLIQGVSGMYTFKIKNLGIGSVEDIAVRTSNIDVNVANTTCSYTPVSSGKITISDYTTTGSCDLALNITRTTPGFFLKDIYFDYKNTNIPLTMIYHLEGNVLSVSKLEFAKNLVDFKNVIITDTKEIFLNLKNKGQRPIDLAYGDFSYNSMGSDISRSIDSTCVAPLEYNDQCQVRFTFAPDFASGIGATHNAQLTLTYFDGKDTIVETVDITGIGVPENTDFNGWKDVLAFGDIFRQTSPTTENKVADRKVKIEWNPMSTPGYTYTGYNIYRSESTATFDFQAAPLASVSSSTYFYEDTDPSLDENKTYYYKVLPTVEAFDSSDIVSETTNLDSIIAIVVPPKNMSLIHRWIYNKQVCEMMNKNPIRTSHYSCSSSGAGSLNSKHDIGYSFFIDMFEVGGDISTSISNNMNQTPLVGLQGDTQNYCASLNISIDDDGDIDSVTGRLPKRRELLHASMWTESQYSAVNKTNTEKLQSGIASVSYSSVCNVNSSSLELTGSRTDCKSRYGLYDAVGNIPEFTSEKMSEGTDLNSIDFQNDLFLYEKELANYNTWEEFSEKTCFNFVIGMHKLPNNLGSCEQSVTLNSSLTKYFLVGDKIKTPLDYSGVNFTPMSGGGFESSTAGPWMIDWFPESQSPQAGFRCVYAF